MIKRAITDKLKALAKTFRVVALTGPRQSGKSTLVKEVFNNYRYISLEDLDIRTFAQSDPRAFFEVYNDHVIIDEAQLVPDLFSYIQGIVDNKKIMGQFILTGSQHFLLYDKISQSLAGRAAYLHLLPLSMGELKASDLNLKSLEETLYRGFYPDLYTTKVEISDWYSNYMRTYVERDLRHVKNIHDLGTFQLFLKMCASRTGQILDFTSIGNDCGISHNTVKGWINILEASFIAFQLRPYYKNFGKRLIKSPKLFFYDTGLLCHLLNIHSAEQLSTHYLRGGIFESFVMSELQKYQFNKGYATPFYFWRDSHGHEVDCVTESGVGIEIKSSKTINQDFFKGLKYWQELSNENPNNNYLVYGGNDSQKRIAATVIPWDSIQDIEFH